MKSVGPACLVFVLFTVITWTSALPAKETTTRRSPQPPFGDPIKRLTSQLMNVSTDVIFDTRTPPKVKQQLKKLSQHSKEKSENSHPGIAVPVDDSDLILEESTKSFNFYKVENKPTTDGGLSTWVLLNSQTVSPTYSTTKTSRKPVVKQKEDNKNETISDSEIFNKITKPLFKKRPATTTTKKPPTTTPKTTTPSEKEYKFTKIKASVLTNAINNKTKTEPKAGNKKLNENTTPLTKKLEEVSTVKSNPKVSTTVSVNDNELIPSIEAKDDEIELITTTQSSKKGRRPSTSSNKRKKNKKRKRPNLEKSDTNSTKIATKTKEKPISTQIYNYLSREIIPTVGVGLVGLMVTAGLASYFLYPFGVARRSYEVDRKDKEDTYYYRDEYAPGGIAEEEAIGKVIAGMPANNYQSYRSPSSRDAYSNLRPKENDYGFRKPSQSSSDPIYLTPSKKYDEEDHFYYRNHKPDYYNIHRNSYNQDIIEHSQETGYTVDDKQFVVGNVPKDIQEVTPAVVPEHGPRNLPGVKGEEGNKALSEISPRSLPEIFTKHGSTKLRIRKRRSTEEENEIDGKVDEDVENSTSTSADTTTEDYNTGLTQPQSLLKYLKSYVENALRVSLEFLGVAARSLSDYLQEVRSRFNNSKSDSVENKEQPRVN